MYKQDNRTFSYCARLLFMISITLLITGVVLQLKNNSKLINPITDTHPIHPDTPVVSVTPADNIIVPVEENEQPVNPAIIKEQAQEEMEIIAEDNINAYYEGETFEDYLIAKYGTSMTFSDLTREYAKAFGFYHDEGNNRYWISEELYKKSINKSKENIL